MRSMSALPPQADIDGKSLNVRFVPKADSRSAANKSLFDHIVGATEHQRRHGETKRSGGLEIDDHFKFGRRLDREVGRLRAFEDAIDVLWRLAKRFDEISAISDQAA